MYTIDIIDQICIVLVFTASLNILMGYAGQATVAHAALGGVGGYAAGWFSAHYGVPFLLTLLIGLVFAGVLGTIVSLPALNLSWDYLVLLTLAVATIFTDVVSTAPQFGGAYGILGAKPTAFGGKQLLEPNQVLPLVGVIALVVLAICWRLGESPYGRVLKAIRGGEVAARSLGKNTVAYKVATFGVTSALAGVGGALLVGYDQLVTPSQFDFDQAILFVTMMILGGSGSLIGTIVGTVVIYASGPVLEHVVSVDASKASLLRLMIYGALLIVLMRFRPQGVFAERRTFWKPTTSDATTALAASPIRMTERRDPNDDVVRTPVALIAEGVSKRFGGLTAVDDVSITLRTGELIGLIGPNGAGKSTLFGLLAGFIRPDSGRIAFAGEDIVGRPSHRIASSGLVRSFQDVQLIQDLTVLDNVALASGANPGERLLPLFVNPVRSRRGEVAARTEALRWLEFVGMQDQSKRVVGELAHAEQKLVALARVLATGGQMLLLDEPTSGVEHRWIERLAEVIVELPSLGRGVCLVEHNLNFLRMLGAPCVFMQSGRIAGQGTLDELMAAEDRREAYFGV